MMKRYFAVVSLAVIALATLAAADVWIEDNVKGVGYVGIYYEADIHVNCNDVPPDYWD